MKISCNGWVPALIASVLCTSGCIKHMSEEGTPQDTGAVDAMPGLTVCATPAPEPMMEMRVADVRRSKARPHPMGEKRRIARSPKPVATSGPVAHQHAYAKKEREEAGFNTEQYDHIKENRFHSAVGTPVSTFSIDVDTASYANVRRFLTSGRLPVREYRLVGYENRLLAKEDFDDDSKDAGELGAGHTVTVLYEIVPETGTPPASGLRYQDANVSGDSEELAFLKLRYKQPDGKKSTLVSEPVSDTVVALAGSSDNFKFSAAVAAWGMLLRGSEHKGNTSFDQIHELGSDARGADLNGYRAEFLKLVSRSAELTPGS